MFAKDRKEIGKFVHLYDGIPFSRLLVKGWQRSNNIMIKTTKTNRMLLEGINR